MHLIDAGTSFKDAGPEVPKDYCKPNKVYDHGMKSLFASANGHVFYYYCYYYYYYCKTVHVI